MRNDDVHLEFGKPHAEARMPSDAPTGIPIWHFLVLGALGEVTRRIPLLRVGIDGRIVMSCPEKICLGRKELLVDTDRMELTSLLGQGSLKLTTKAPGGIISSPTRMFSPLIFRLKAAPSNCSRILSLRQQSRKANSVSQASIGRLAS